ncbi:MAG TPA: SRPBCC family protein [Planctomycetota bacterium]|nr:SRPBCC family protein [Planctomycetota bacterium]
MPHGVVIENFPAARAEVFQLLHNYDRRLEWDTMLQAAYLSDGYRTAQLHATSICKGRWYHGGIVVKTEYVVFNPPDVAAVKMTNKPPFFATFAASIHHRDISDGMSQVEYTYTFTARPTWMRWLLHPIMSAFFRFETKKRLRALRAFFTKRRGEMTAH